MSEEHIADKTDGTDTRADGGDAAGDGSNEFGTSHDAQTDELQPTLGYELSKVEAVRDRLADRFGADEVSVDAHQDGAGVTLRYRPEGADAFGEASEWATEVSATIEEQTDLDVSMGVETQHYDSETGEMVDEPEGRVTGRAE